ncbi:MAG: hypothetical protein U0075_09655 [Thermomicrobiales bacterium]
MFPLEIVPDSAVMERDALRTDLRNSLGVITGRAQRLQRQILRSNGLTRRDREEILHGLVAVLAEVERMGPQVEELVARQTPFMDRRSASWPVATETPTPGCQDGGFFPRRPQGEEPLADDASR